MKPTIHRPTCGTEKGYRSHQRNREERCQPCKSAWNERCKKYKPVQPSADEVAEEIEHMLRLNQGHGYILTAIGYNGRTQALEKRMRQNGHAELARWAVNLERDAA